VVQEPTGSAVVNRVQHLTIQVVGLSTIASTLGWDRPRGKTRIARGLLRVKRRKIGGND